MCLNVKRDHNIKKQTELGGKDSERRATNDISVFRATVQSVIYDLHGGVTPTMAMIIKVIIGDRIDHRSGQLVFIDDVSLKLKSAVYMIVNNNSKNLSNLNNIFRHRCIILYVMLGKCSEYNINITINIFLVLNTIYYCVDMHVLKTFDLFCQIE